MLNYVVRKRDWLENAILVMVLPFVAGAVNASGFMMLGVYTSHVTGNVARIGDELAQGNLSVCIAWSGDVSQMKLYDNDKVEFVIPESGGMLWVDNMAVPVNARHPLSRTR